MKLEFVIDIPAPREFVWGIAQNGALRPSWDVRVLSYTVHAPPGDTPQRGTAMTIALRGLWIRAVARGQYVRFDPPRQSAIRIDSISNPLIPLGGGTWIFDETPEGTRWTTRFTLKYSKPRPVLEWFVQRVVTWDTTRAQRNLKNLVLRRIVEEGNGQH